MNSVTCQASAERRRRTGARVSSGGTWWARRATGHQTTKASTPSSAQTASAPCQPSPASARGTLMPPATPAMPTIVVR
jgi:hypothetical protein